MQKVQSHTTKKAFSTVEVLLAIGLFSITVLGLASAIAYSVQSNAFLSYKIKASYLADEGIEAVKNIRDSNFASLTNGTYGLAISSNSWNLSGTSDTTDGYVRRIQISSIDSNTKKIVSTVTWPQQTGQVNSVSYVSYLTNWFRSVALPNWSTPTINSTLDLTGNTDGIKVFIKDNYAYILKISGNPNLFVVNILNSDAPTLVTSLNIGGTSGGMAISGNYLYIASQDNNSELKIVNIANPVSPTLVGTYDALGNSDGNNVFVENNKAYLVRKNEASSQEFMVINVTNPAAPTLLGSLEMSMNLMDVFVSGSYAYIGAQSNSQEIRVVNISNPASMSVVTNLNLTGSNNVTSVELYGTTLYVGTNLGNFFAVDIENVPTLTQLGVYNVGSGNDIDDIAFSSDGKEAFLATNNTSKDFEIVNITNSSNMTTLSNLNLSNIIYGVTYDSITDKIYVVGAADTAELTIIGRN